MSGLCSYPCTLNPLESHMKRNLKSLSDTELSLLMEKLGQKPYRSRQVYTWLYKKHASSIEEMTDLPGELRDRLKESTYVSGLNLLKKQSSRDGTEKFLFALEDGESIEAVLIPDNRRLTLCISSQIGCAMGCRFCATGQLGLKRNLKAYEMVDQVMFVQKYLGQRKGITNIVLMGMGEPLHNFTEVAEALFRMTTRLGFSKRKITLSTAGIIPKITALPEKAPLINLAVSLNATTDEVRNNIMPINKTYPLDAVMNACREFPLEPRRRITFEYIMLGGLNDSAQDARRLVRLLHGIRSKVNLIPYNRVRGLSEFKKSPEKKLLEFQKILLDSGITAIIRKSKGSDIAAACGQLKALTAGKRERLTVKS